MKRQLLIISVLVIIVSLFVSCSSNSSSANVSKTDISTTAVADSEGEIHYYEIITDNEGSTVYAEIMTDDKNKAVTNKNGTYVTKEHSTILSPESTVNSSGSITESVTQKAPAEQSSGTTHSNADNSIEFEPEKSTDRTKPSPSTTTEKSITTTKKETTTQKTTQSATDKDGWINKWY